MSSATTLYHLSPITMRPEICVAAKGHCRYKTKHYDTEGAAYAAMERQCHRARAHQAGSVMTRLRASFKHGDYRLKTMAITGVGLAVAGFIGGAVLTSAPEVVDTQPVEIVQAASTPSSYQTYRKITYRVNKISQVHRVKTMAKGYENTVKLPSGAEVNVHSDKPMTNGTKDIVYTMNNDGVAYLKASDGSILEHVELPGSTSRGHQAAAEIHRGMNAKTLSSAAIAGIAGVMVTAAVQGSYDYRHDDYDPDNDAS